MRMLVLLLGLVLAGCGGSASPPARPSAQATTQATTLGQLGDRAGRVVRVAFCDLVPRTAVRAALAGGSLRSRSWRNGDPVPEAGGETGHEFGCAWFGPRSSLARAWVFARPVSPSFAASLVRQARAPRARAVHGCTAGSSTTFGTPSLLQTCRGAGGTLRIRRAGLFGDSWLTCEVGGPGTQTALRARADAWCVSVANVLDAG